MLGRLDIKLGCEDGYGGDGDDMYLMIYRKELSTDTEWDILGRTERVKTQRGKGFAYSKSFFVNALDTTYPDLKIQAMRYSPSTASFKPTNDGARVSTGTLYTDCSKSGNGDAVISLNIDSKCRVWLYAFMRRGTEFLLNFDFQTPGAGFVQIERPRIAAMPIPLWTSEISRTGSWNNCVVSSRKICNSGDLDASILISWYRNKYDRMGSCTFSLSSVTFKKRSVCMQLRSARDHSVTIGTLNISCFKSRHNKGRELHGLFRRREPPSSSSSSSQISKLETKTSSIVVHQKKSDNETALYEINRRGSVLPVSRTTNIIDAHPFMTSSFTSYHYLERKKAIQEECTRLETLNELFLKLEDKRPFVKIKNKHDQLEAIEREMHHLLSLRLKRKKTRQRQESIDSNEEKERSSHLIAYHSKSALVRKRHERTDDKWSKTTRYARDNIFLKRAAREFQSHTRHSIFASKKPSSILRTPNLEKHWGKKSRVQTHSLPDDGSWYEIRFGTKAFHDKEFGPDDSSLWIDGENKSSSLSRAVGWKRISDIFDSPMMQTSLKFMFRDDYTFKCKRLQFQQVHDFEEASENVWRESSDNVPTRERYQLMKDLVEEAVYSIFNNSCGPLIALMDSSVGNIVRHERFLDVWKRMSELASPAHFAGVSSKIEVKSEESIAVHVLIHFHRPAPKLFQRHHNHTRSFTEPGTLHVGAVPNGHNLIGASMLCASHPYVLSNLFPRTKDSQRQLQTFNESGMYSVRLFLEGEWRVVVVDDFLPVDKNGQPVCCGFGFECEIWGAILEKAVAKIEGSYEALKSLDTQYCISMFLGGPSFQVPVPRPPTKATTSDEKSERMWCYLIEALEVRNFGFVPTAFQGAYARRSCGTHIVGVSTHVREHDDGLVVLSNYIYPVDRILEYELDDGTVEKVVCIRDVWRGNGLNTWKDDSLKHLYSSLRRSPSEYFLVRWNDFLAHWTAIHVGIIARPEEWTCHSVQSEWFGISAASENSLRSPQFQLVCRGSDKKEFYDNTSRFVHVMLTQQKQMNEDDAPMGCRVLERCAPGYRKLQHFSRDKIAERWPARSRYLHMSVSLKARQNPVTIVPYRMQSGSQNRFFMTVFTPKLSHVKIESIPFDRTGYKHERRISGYVNERESGGSFPVHPTWHRNPQYSFHIQTSDRVILIMERRAYTKDLTDDRSRKLISPTISIGYVLFLVGRNRIDPSRNTKSEAYRSQLSYIPHESMAPVVRQVSRLSNEGEIVDELNLDAGHYILIPVSSEPGLPFPFSFSALSMSRLELIKRVGEPVVRVSR